MSAETDDVAATKKGKAPLITKTNPQRRVKKRHVQNSPSDLKLKGLTLSDRQLLEALYMDLQVEPAADPHTLNLAAPMMILLRSLVHERTGIDPDKWARKKTTQAKVVLESGVERHCSRYLPSTRKTNDEKALFQPRSNTFYFASSENRYKAMGRQSIMKSFEACKTGASSASIADVDQFRLNSHSNLSLVHAARIKLFQMTHPAAPSWKSIFRPKDFSLAKRVKDRKDGPTVTASSVEQCAAKQWIAAHARRRKHMDACEGTTMKRAKRGSDGKCPCKVAAAYISKTGNSFESAHRQKGGGGGMAEVGIISERGHQRSRSNSINIEAQSAEDGRESPSWCPFMDLFDDFDMEDLCWISSSKPHRSMDL